MAFFPPLPFSCIFSRVTNSRFYLFFSFPPSFLLLRFLAGAWLYVFTAAYAVYGEQQQQECFVWPKMWAAKYPSPVFVLPIPAADWEDESAACLCGLRRHLKSAKAFSCIPFSHGYRLQGSARSLSKQSSRSFPSLCFIFCVCGLREKKLIGGGSCHRGIQIVWVWPRPLWPSRRTLFSLIMFDLILHL